MRRTAESLAVLAAVAAACAALPGRAAAQHHHHGAGAEAAPGIQAHAGVSFEVGRVESFGADRDYQGVAVMAGARRGAAEIALHLPFYRIELGGAWGESVGDPHIEARWNALALAGGAVEAGLSFAVMPSIGDDDQGLAMGHWMIMTGGFARVSRGRLSGAASLGYGGALGGGGHAEHGGGVWPPVAPMNSHEIEASIQPQIALGRGVGLVAGLSGAAPIGDGKVIGLVEAGATIALGRFELGVRAGHGVAGHPGGLRGATHVMAAF
jgi:hypothetical protein